MAQENRAKDVAGMDDSFGLAFILPLLWRSISVALLAVSASLLPALLLAYLFAKKDFPLKFFVEWLVMLPLVLPPVISGYALLMLFGRSGLVGHWLDAIGLEIAFSYSALVLAGMVMAFPLMIRTLRSALESVDHGLEEAGLSLGMNERQVLFSVILPSIKPALISAMLLGFARVIGEFGATIVFAGNIPGKTQTLTLAIFSAIQSPLSGKPLALLIAIVIVISGLSLALSSYLSQPFRQPKPQKKSVDELLSRFCAELSFGRPLVSCRT